MDACILRGVRTHNLKGIDLSIPFGRLTVVSGVSGSGKSSLVFDTVYAEGQRRFVDCMTTYARQFLERLDRPDADSIGRLEPPLAIRQSVAVRNARSTVGTLTEIADHLQLLFAKAGQAHCLSCGAPVTEETLETAVDRACAASERLARLVVAAPIERDRLGADGLRGLIAQGYLRGIVDGVVEDWPAAWVEDTKAEATPERLLVVIDRLKGPGFRRGRVAEAMESAWSLGRGEAILYAPGADEASLQPCATLRRGLVCSSCGARGEPLRVALFHAGNALGACPACQGFGRGIVIDPDKVVPDARLSLKDHAVVPFRMPSRRGWYRRMLKLAPEAGIRTGIAWSMLEDRERRWVMEGSAEGQTPRFPGVRGLFRMLEKKRYRMHVRIFLARFRGYVPCATCLGTRLTPAALAVRIEGRNLADLNDTPIAELRRFFDDLRLPRGRASAARTVLTEIRSRLRCLEEVGLGYLTLGRTARTLSGGETQRLRLAAGIGSSLTRTLFILDEPTVGLHARDTARVLGVLRRITASGNTVLVVEHDPGVVEGADHLTVLGPRGGEDGGQLLYEGAPEDFLRRDPGFFRLDSEERTAARGSEDPGSVVRDQDPRTRAVLALAGVRANNLDIEALEIPLHALVAITGVSGSGKSTLLDEVIHRNWRRHRGLAVEDVGSAHRIDGFDQVDDVLLIGQEPLGRSVRSNAVSFVKVLPVLRDLLAKSPESRARRLRARDFSFNVPGGRCEACKGLGTVVLEMHFLPDVEVSCEACKGRRFREEVLQVAYRGYTIRGMLEMTADEAAAVFADRPEVARRLLPLQQVGLGYLRLGQPTSTLSGGEAQRLKLASFLAEGRAAKRRIFLFDEPTTGLHARDIALLLEALRRLLAQGDSVIVVEHHLDLIGRADWVIDLGPGPGEDGGRIVFAGPPAGLRSCRDSATGRALASHGRRP